MENQSNLQGNNNIVIQGVTDSTITLNVNGETQQILNKLEVLQDLLQKLQSPTIQTADKTYNIGTISEANFGFLMGQVAHNKKLPLDLAENLITDDNRWVQSLQQDLLRQNVSVGNKPWAIFQHYGWLIEAFLQKMGTAIGKERSLRRLSFMAEAFQSSLRYLCYIQVAQILQLETKHKHLLLTEFIEREASQSDRFDYLNLLLITTDILKDQEVFMPEINDFVYNLTDTKDDLYGTALFLEENRNKLLADQIEEEDQFDHLLDKYLTALVFWLRQISFLAKYRLVSIKDINLHYKLGTAKTFVHIYGELHGTYSEALATGEDYSAYSIEEGFTYNHSVLLFNGSNVEACLEKIKTTPPLSLSPLIIDQSVYTEKLTQTPEIYYYTGKGHRQYLFAQYKNELAYSQQKAIPSNKTLQAKRQNINQPKLDELFEQLERVFKTLNR